MVKYLYNPIAKGSKALCKSVGFEPRRLMQQGAVEVADGDISKAASFVSDWDFIHRTIGFDLGLTFIYSFAHEATYKTLAAFGFKTTENGDAAEKKNILRYADGERCNDSSKAEPRNTRGRAGETHAPHDNGPCRRLYAAPGNGGIARFMSMTPTTDKESNAPKLEAQKKFDQWVYGGISYFAQAATGIVLARWIRNGSGKKYFDAMSQWMGPRVITPLTGKLGEEAVKAADSPIVVSTMIMCGNAFLIPVKMIENHKPAIVRKWQYAINAKREKKGEIISEAERNEQEMLLDKLEKKPNQSWISLGIARAASLVGVYAVLFGIGNKNNIAAEKFFADGVQHGMKNAGLKQMGESETTQSYLRMIFNDGFYSAISAGGLYVWSHFVMPPKKKPSGEALLDVGEELAEEITDITTPATRKKPEQDCPTGRCPKEPTSRLAALKSLSTQPEQEASVNV